MRKSIYLLAVVVILILSYTGCQRRENVGTSYTELIITAVSNKDNFEIDTLSDCKVEVDNARCTVKESCSKISQSWTTYTFRNRINDPMVNIPSDIFLERYRVEHYYYPPISGIGEGEQRRLIHLDEFDAEKNMNCYIPANGTATYSIPVMEFDIYHWWLNNFGCDADPLTPGMQECASCVGSCASYYWHDGGDVLEFVLKTTFEGKDSLGNSVKVTDYRTYFLADYIIGEDSCTIR